MERITAREVCGAVSGKLLGNAEASFDMVYTDSRKCKPDGLFAAIPGDNFDGHRFIGQAFENGASVVLCEENRFSGISGGLAHYLEQGRAVVLTGETRTALLRLAGWYKSRFDVISVAVTGSVGKTTTKEYIAAILSHKYKTHKNYGNYNNDIGVSLTIFGLDASYEALVSEMGMNNAGEIKQLSKCVRPDVAIITNIGTSHIENLGTRGGILRAKLEITAGLRKPGGYIITNADEPLLEAEVPLLRREGYNVIRAGIENARADIRAVDLSFDYGKNTTEFTAVSEMGARRIVIPSVGAHNVQNALYAVSVGDIYGIDAGSADRAFSSVETIAMRQNIYTRGGFTVIDDCYNASPESMRAAFDTMASMPSGGKRIAVLADMLELGTHAGRLHREVGGYAAKSGIDVLITYGEAAEGYITGADEYGLSGIHAPNRDEAVEKLREYADEGDLILFKASRGMRMELLIDEFFRIDTENQES